MVRKGQYIWGNSVFEMSDSPYTLEQQAAEDHHEEDPPALEWETYCYSDLKSLDHFNLHGYYCLPPAHPLKWKTEAEGSQLSGKPQKHIFKVKKVLRCSKKAASPFWAGWCCSGCNSDDVLRCAESPWRWEQCGAQKPPLLGWSAQSPLRP